MRLEGDLAEPVWGRERQDKFALRRTEFDAAPIAA
jgi:hypothetical protein